METGGERGRERREGEGNTPVFLETRKTFPKPPFPMPYGKWMCVTCVLYVCAYAYAHTCMYATMHVFMYVYFMYGYVPKKKKKGQKGRRKEYP
jgi:hypothetical protein